MTRRTIPSIGFCTLLLLLVPGFTRAANPKYPWQQQELEHKVKSHTEIIENSPHTYNISMAGTVDMDHAMTRDYGAWKIAWQPNESIVIDNIGTDPVEGIKLLANDRGDWYSLDGIVREAIQEAKTDQEIAYSIWNFVRSNRYHHNSLWNKPFRDEEHDPVKMLAIYGGGLCDDTAKVSVMLFRHAVPNKYRTRSMDGHVVNEFFVGGRWQFFDADENAFYLDRENACPVSGDDAARDHELVMREFHYGPKFSDWTTAMKAAKYFGGGDRKFEGAVYPTRPLHIRLRPSEKIEFRWDNIGKYASDQKDEDMPFFGNSKQIFTPRLNAPRADADIAKNICLLESANAPEIASRQGPGELVYSMQSAFVIAGGQIRASFSFAGEKDSASIAVKAENNKGMGKTDFIEIWKSSGAGPQDAKVEIDEAIKPLELSPEYAFEVRIQLVSAGGERTAVLKHLEIQADTLVSPIFLPRLKLGLNRLAYSDQSPSRRLRVDHVWKETSAAASLPAPALLAPAKGTAVEEELVRYRWQAVPGAGAYHLQVSRDSEFRWPYRSSLDVILPADTQTYGMPFPGLYDVDTVFFWRVRTRNEKGIWGDWSAAETFSWNGPCIPVNVRLEKQGETYVLRWQPNPKGTRPAEYEIYGSDLKGFPVSKVPFEIPEDGGTFASNYLGKSAKTEMIVAGAQLNRQPPEGIQIPENLNRCYYRVVAVDKKGIHSGCSDYAEMPHPYIISTPPASVQTGQMYYYQPQVISSLGDFQHRFEKPQNGYFEKENLRFSLINGPNWLQVDEQTGRLSGTAPAAKSKTLELCLRVTASFEERKGDDLEAMPTPPDRIYDQKFILNIK